MTTSLYWSVGVVDTCVSDHVYCVAVTFKMTEQGEQQICIKFCLKLEHSCMETIQMIQIWATGDWLLGFITTKCRLMHHVAQSFLAKHQITQVTQPPYSPNLAPCDFWLFPKLKSPLKWKRFQTVDEIQEYTTGQLMVTGKTVWGPKVSTLKGTEASLSYVQCFLYLVSSSINVSFSYHMAGYLLDRPHILNTIFLLIIFLHCFFLFT